MMAGREFPQSATGNFGRYGSEIKSSASNAPPTYRKYRARGIPHSICPLPATLIGRPVNGDGCLLGQCLRDRVGGHEKSYRACRSGRKDGTDRTEGLDRRRQSLETRPKSPTRFHEEAI